MLKKNLLIMQLNFLSQISLQFHIDKQLYAKYELTNEEISFIESMIKPMV